jgi:hypothetical protein
MTLPSNNNSSETMASVVAPPRSKEAEAMIRRVEIACELFETAFEIKSLELRRRNPDATDAWIRGETLRLIEAGCK